MRNSKKERLKEEQFWSVFRQVNGIGGAIPAYVRRVNLRVCGADDDSLLYLTRVVKQIDQLDLDETDVTDQGIAYLCQLECLKELRLKDCNQVDDSCMEQVCAIGSLELLHLGGTSVTLVGLRDIGQLTHLKMLLISADEKERDALTDIALMLPGGCEFIVNHREFEL